MTQAKQPEGSTVRELMDERDEARFNAAATRGMLESAMRKVATLTARNERLVEALKPFAEFAELLELETEGFADRDIIKAVVGSTAEFPDLTFGHFRAAGRALEGE